MTHSASPTPYEIAGTDMASLKDAKRRHQLLFKEPTAPSVIGKRGQCFDHWNVTATGAIGTFHTPNGTNNFCGNAKSIFDLCQKATVFTKSLTAIRDATV